MYTLKLTNGETFEHMKRGFWEQCLEAWGWRTFKKPDGTYINIPKSSIVYFTSERDFKLRENIR